MKYIKGVTFCPFAKRGTLLSKESKKSLILLKELTEANTVVFVPVGLQKTPQSVEIDYKSDATFSDDELKETINFCSSINLNAIIKPTVNCLNGVWRAYIDFFDNDVPCEPKWSQWFKSYTDFQLHYARISEEMGLEIFIAGCEMVMAQRREKECRKLIDEIRKVYSGKISYNTDKYQEENVSWWDCVDIISSSGYYPIDDISNQLDRIQTTVNKYNKPFFFAECGCKSAKGSEFIPNDWSIKGEVDLKAQADWYDKFLYECSKRKWINGTVIWEWNNLNINKALASADESYSIYNKPAESIVKRHYMKV